MDGHLYQLGEEVGRYFPFQGGSGSTKQRKIWTHGHRTEGDIGTERTGWLLFIIDYRSKLRQGVTRGGT